MMINKHGCESLLRPTSWLAGDVVLATVPDDLAPGGCPRGLPRGVQPPFGTVLLNVPGGRLRLAAFRRPEIAGTGGREAASASFALFDDAPDHPTEADAPLADREEDWQLAEALASPEDPVALASVLDKSSQRRLLDFLLGFCRTAFRLGRDGDFATVCTRLAALCGTDAADATPIAQVLPARVLLRGPQVRPGERMFLLGPSGARLIRAPGHAQCDGLLIMTPPLPGDRLLVLGSEVQLWQIAMVETLPHVLSLSGADLSAARAACLRALAPAAPGSEAAALLRELHVLAPAATRRHDDPALPIGGALDLALPDGDGCVFLAGWLRDPHELLAGAELITPAGTQLVDTASLHRVSRPDLKAMLARAQAASGPAGTDGARPGFVARVADPSGGAALQPTLRLKLRSGAPIELTPPLRPLAPMAARDAVLSSVRPQEASAEILAQCLAPAARGLHRLACAQRGREQVIRIGRRLARPAVSILVPLYRNLGFLRFQLAAFAEDPTCRSSEIIYALDSPEQAGEAEHLLRGLQHLHDLPVTLVLMERNGGFAAATNAAARHATGTALLLLNSDVVPLGTGWLDALQAARARTGAVAATAKLLFDDGSLQHAGLYFARDSEGNWYNDHYYKGRPNGWPGSDTARPVPGGTGAALLIEQRAFARLGGVCEDYIVGDYEDSDLCLRLQQEGGGIVYEPRAALYHFERRSIALHPGYIRTLACQYNRLLHQQRWDAAMTALMQTPQFHPPSANLRSAA